LKTYNNRAYKRKDLRDQRFGRLLVIMLDKHGETENTWICQCDCGERKITRSRLLLSGKTRSCGCWRKEAAKKLLPLNITHGDARKHRRIEYKTWGSMIQRCTNPHDSSYPRYGGRGIKVCSEWLKSYEQFRKDMGRKPKPYSFYSLDRLDNNGNYEPGNCRWATVLQQANNKRNTIPYERL
jgi:hypothetical protein